MTKYIMPIIKDKEKKEQKKDIRLPLYKRPPMPHPLDHEKDQEDDDADSNIVDFNIDGNIVDVSIRV